MQMIVEQLAGGKTVEQIANETNRAQNTVDADVKALMAVIDMHTQAGVVGKFMREGWIK